MFRRIPTAFKFGGIFALSLALSFLIACSLSSTSTGSRGTLSPLSSKVESIESLTPEGMQVKLAFEFLRATLSYEDPHIYPGDSHGLSIPLMNRIGNAKPIPLSLFSQRYAAVSKAVHPESAQTAITLFSVDALTPVLTRLYAIYDEDPQMLHTVPDYLLQIFPPDLRLSTENLTGPSDLEAQLTPAQIIVLLGLTQELERPIPLPLVDLMLPKPVGNYEGYATPFSPSALFYQLGFIDSQTQLYF